MTSVGWPNAPDTGERGRPTGYLEIERPSASLAPSTGDLPWCSVARVVSFLNEPNDLRKQVTWPGRRGIRQALARRRDYAALKRGICYFSDRLVRARVKFRHGILVPPYSSASQYSSRRNRMSHHRDLPLPEAAFSAPVKCENRLVALVCLICLVCLVEQDQLTN